MWSFAILEYGHSGLRSVSNRNNTICTHARCRHVFITTGFLDKNNIINKCMIKYDLIIPTILFIYIVVNQC